MVHFPSPRPMLLQSVADCINTYPFNPLTLHVAVTNAFTQYKNIDQLFDNNMLSHTGHI